MVLWYRDPADAISSVPPLEAQGEKAGRGLVEISGTRVYLLGVNHRLNHTERDEFQKAYTVAENG